MILKRWIDAEARWEFWDGIERISHQREIKEANDSGISKETVRILLVFRDDKKESFEIVIEGDSVTVSAQAYILNDEGKTIERIN